MRLLRIAFRALIAAAALIAVAPAGAQTVPGYTVTVYSTLPGPTGLAFDMAGNLYVGQDVPASGAITDQFVRRVPTGGGAPTDYGPFPLPDPRGVYVDPTPDFAAEAGSVIVSGPTTGTSGQTVAILPSELAPLPGAMVQVLHDAGAGGAVAPSYMEKGQGGLLIVDPAQKAVLELVPPALTLAPLITDASTPRFLAVEGADIFVSYDDAIRKYDAMGNAATPDFASGLDGPLPIAVSPGGDFPAGLYAIETGAGKLLAFDALGAASVIGTGFPNNLGEIEFGADGALYVASFGAGEILRVALSPPPADLGPFICYHAKDSSRFGQVVAEVEDAFDHADERVSKTKGLCNPATVSGGGIVSPVANADLETRLAGHAVKRVPRGPLAPHALTVTNALGSQSVRTLKADADRLLLPSAVATTTPPPLTSSAVDAFRCYEVRSARGTSFAPTDVTVADTVAAAALSRVLTLKKPKHLCMPAALVPGTIGRPDDLLVCYAARPVKGQPKTPGFSGLHVTDPLTTDYGVDVASPARTTTSFATRSGRITGDVFGTSAEGAAAPGEWNLEDSEGPRWSGGGSSSTDAESLSVTFSDGLGLGDSQVLRWRLFLEIDIAVNNTNTGPGVVMRSSGVPGIPDGTELRAMAHGKPAGLRVSSPFFSPPDGTTLGDLVEGGGATQPTLVLAPDGDGSDSTFAFQIKRFGIEYEARVASERVQTGVPESELCLPSTTL